MKIYLDTIGCRLNQAEIEAMGRQFRAAGHQIVASAAEADMAVVNTCAVTGAAASDSRAAVRRAARAGAADVVVTGCWATLQGRQAAELPGVTRVVPNAAKDRLVPQLLALPFEAEPLAREPLPGLHQRTRAFIKVQDGCNNHCTFCVTALARGHAVSRPLADVISDVQAAVAGGAHEIVLTGVHLGSWGAEWGSHLRRLVQAMLHDTDVLRLRLSSLEPWDLDEAFFRLWENARLCRHLHLPLQSGSAATLRRMARKTTPDSFRRLVRAARAVMPEVAITTDVIAGFPGETEAEFAESLSFIEEVQFAGGHAFTYCAGAGTAAARMSSQVPPPVRKQRNARYRAAFERMAAIYRSQFVGQEVSVLWESTTALDDQGWELAGLTDNYLRVAARAPKPLWNHISPVHIQTVHGDHLSGVILGQGAKPG